MYPDTIPALLRETVSTVPDRLALIDGEVRLTWAELSSRVHQVARGLMALGIRRGDRVMMLGPNGHHWIEASLGALLVGAVVIPVNTRYTGYEILDLLERTRARLLFSATGFLRHSFLDMVREAARSEFGEGATTRGPVRGLPDLTAVVEWVHDHDAPKVRAEALDHVHQWSDLITHGSSVTAKELSQRTATITSDDPADIVYTSGTTGRSKGAVSLHRQTVACARAWAENVRVVPEDNYLIVSPFAHTFGYKAGMLVCVSTGATMLPMATFDTRAVLELSVSEQVTVVPGAPTIFQMILDQLESTSVNLPWRVAVTGAATVPVRLVERMHEELGLESVITGYGLSEAVTVTMTAYDDPPERVVTSAGRLIADFEIRIRDESGNVLGPGATGEIEIRGPNVMQGYLDDEPATRAAIDEDGWLCTGDVGTMSADGYLSVTDRIKDMFTVGGFNVYPAEIEHVLSRLPGVTESCVVGVPHARLGAVGKVFVIRAHGTHLDEEDVTDYLRSRMGNFKVPRFVEFVDELPRNHAGKVLKRVLLAADDSPNEAGMSVVATPTIGT